jgi:hypothetical protein
MVRESSQHTSFIYMKLPDIARYSTLSDRNGPGMCRFQEDERCMLT